MLLENIIVCLMACLSVYGGAPE